jgi:hypothetical protein
MTTVVRSLACLVGIAAVLLPVAAIGAGNMTRADFDRCNQQAMLAAGVSVSQTPSASPTTSGASVSGGAGSGATSSSGTGISTSSPSGNTVSSPASGSVSSPSASGSISSTPPSGAAAGGTISSGSTVSGSGQSVSSSATASGGSDQQLERAVQAYRDCLRR